MNPKVCKPKDHNMGDLFGWIQNSSNIPIYTASKTNHVPLFICNNCNELVRFNLYTNTRAYTQSQDGFWNGLIIKFGEYEVD